MSRNVRLIVKISKDAADVKEAILNEIDRLIKEGEGSSTDEKMHTTELRRDYDYTTYEVVCVIEESRDEEKIIEIAEVDQDAIQYYLTTSDAGGVKLGSDDFSVIIPNGSGDGDTSVKVVPKAKREGSEPDKGFFTVIEGKFNIYSHDCGSRVVDTIDGRYGVYSNNGTVTLVEWRNWV